MNNLVLRISGIRNLEATLSRKQLAFSRVDGRDLVVESGLPPNSAFNDQLVSIWGHIRTERRYLKSLHDEGAEFHIFVPSEALPLELKPNGAEMLHLLGVTLRVGAK